jgi:DNA-directed RNA polymerase specialized sigma24 family protein
MIANAHMSAWRKFGRRVSPLAEVTRGDAVWRVCSALPRQQRAAVVLHFYEDLDYAEIARILEIAEVTVRSHIHRALATLRAELERGESDHG